MTADRKLTQTGSTVGSLYYMSPEQIKGAVDLDPRSDLYSLGVTLYEVVTGVRPFQGDSEYTIMAAHLQQNPPPPIEISPNLPSGLNEIILQALEKDPAKRFQTADAFRNALLYVCRQPQAAAPVIPPAVPQPKTALAPPKIAPPPPQAARSHRGLWIAIGAVIAIAVIVVLATQIPKFRKTAAENAPAQPAADTSGAAIQAPESSPGVQTDQAQDQVSPASSQETLQQAAPAAGTPSEQLKPAAKAASYRPAGMQSPISTQAVSGNQQPAPGQSALPAAPSEDPKTAEPLREVREQLNLLSVRMDTAKSSLDALRKQQAASGLGLRADMASSAQRMEYYYSQSETALKNRDVETAKKNLDLTEREVSKLENFLSK
jgi:serine/threonine-protein kinase